MNTISIDLINPASITLLEELEKLQLITIHRGKKAKNRNSDFIDFVHKIRSKSNNPPSLEEITAEVEQQRTEMYAISTQEKKGHNRY